MNAFLRVQVAQAVFILGLLGILVLRGPDPGPSAPVDEVVAEWIDQAFHRISHGPLADQLQQAGQGLGELFAALVDELSLFVNSTPEEGATDSASQGQAGTVGDGHTASRSPGWESAVLVGEAGVVERKDAAPEENASPAPAGPAGGPSQETVPAARAEAVTATSPAPPGEPLRRPDAAETDLATLVAAGLVGHKDAAPEEDTPPGPAGPAGVASQATIPAAGAEAVTATPPAFPGGSTGRPDALESAPAQAASPAGAGAAEEATDLATPPAAGVVGHKDAASEEDTPPGPAGPAGVASQATMPTAGAEAVTATPPAFPGGSPGRPDALESATAQAASPAGAGAAEEATDLATPPAAGVAGHKDTAPEENAPAGPVAPVPDPVGLEAARADGYKAGPVPAPDPSAEPEEKSLDDPSQAPVPGAVVEMESALPVPEQEAFRGPLAVLDAANPGNAEPVSEPARAGEMEPAPPAVEQAARLKTDPPADTDPRPRPASSIGTPYYRVQSGDVLSSIALRSGKDLRDIANWNGLLKPYKIYEGQRLRLRPKPPQRIDTGYYRVEFGDNLSSIARRSGKDLRDIANWNGLLKPYKIYEGQHLRLRPPPPPKIDAGYYRVQPGDTLSGIARRSDKDIDDIARWNGLRKPYRIFGGQRLRLQPPGVSTGPLPREPGEPDVGRVKAIQAEPGKTAPAPSSVQGEAPLALEVTEEEVLETAEAVESVEEIGAAETSGPGEEAGFSIFGFRLRPDPVEPNPEEPAF